MVKKYNLFKYYAPTKYNFDALERGYWFFSKFGHANDPFDCDARILDLIKNKWNLKSTDIKNGSLKDFAICSFSDSPLNKHLWALYSDCYKGFVVEYEYSEDIYMSFATKELPIPLFKVSYLDKEEIETETDIPATKLIPPKASNLPPARDEQEREDDLFYYLYSIKEKSIWSAENEMRLLLGNIKPDNPDVMINCTCHNGYKVFFPNTIVKRIILGNNCCECNKTKLLQIANQYKVKVEQVIVEEPFELALKQIDTNGAEKVNE